MKVKHIKLIKTFLFSRTRCRKINIFLYKKKTFFHQTWYGKIQRTTFFLKIKTDFFVISTYYGDLFMVKSLKYTSSENCTFSFPALTSPLPIVKSYNKAWAKLSSFFKNLSVFRSLRFSTIWDKTLPYLNVSHTRANNCFLFCKIKINNTYLPYFCR